MARYERNFQKDLMDEIRAMFPGCVIQKMDANYLQGFPDWLILYKDRWAVLEAKISEEADWQPNQEDYVARLNYMSFSRFVYPENKDEVLEALYRHFMY